MSEVSNSKIEKPKTYTLPIGQAYIRGRISSFRKQRVQDRGLLFFSILRIPAVDEYSFPGTVELTSSSMLGQIGVDWEGFVEITGMGNNFETKPDPHTGEVTQVRSARNWLRVVE